MTRNKNLAISFVAFVLALAFVPGIASAAWPDDPARVNVPTERLAGADRYSAAVAIARSAYPDWSGVSHVVIASGEDRASGDPLAASGLCWAYDAPLLLTTAGQTPGATRDALAQIASVNPTVTVIVVGGTRSVPAARVREIRSATGGRTIVQPWTSGDRYSLAEGISQRVSSVAAATGRTRPNAVFVANGAEPKRFTDALAASAVSRNTGIPVLLTAGNWVPAPTVRAINALGQPETIVVGGPLSVTANAYTGLGAEGRWYGQNRFATAAEVARNAVARGWSNGQRVGVAAKVPDALAGAAAIGRSGGVVLATDTERLPIESWSRVVALRAGISRCSVLGGTASVRQTVADELAGAPGRPIMDAPAAYVGKTMRVAGRANSNTTMVTLFIGGRQVATRTVEPYGSYDFGSFDSPSRSVVVEVRASNPDGRTCSATRAVTRMIYPYATCIIVDKSDFRLYWIRNNDLVKVYPIAIGRDGMETPVRTWKILAKYRTDPSSVYGPRKMRLFKPSGSSWEFTAYAIHGTNQPWVIGTKASHGCIRMYNADVLELFPQVPVGTMVITRQ